MTAASVTVPANDVDVGPRHWRFGAVAALITAAYVIGGTSAHLPVRAMFLELLAIVTIAIVLASWRGGAPSPSVRAAIALVLGVPLLQMIPLPPSWWTALPGREVAADIARFVDPTMMQPLTLDWNMTLKGWLSLLVPMATFLAVLQSPLPDRVRLSIVVTAIALASMLIGLLQVLAGDSLYFYETTHRGLPLGFFANRNHQAALLYVAIPLTMALASVLGEKNSVFRLTLTVCATAFFAAILATTSRTGLVLGGLALLLSLPLVFRVRLGGKAVLGIVVGIGVGAFALTRSGVVREALARFAEQATDGRYDLWPEVIYAAGTYFPAGTGLGTFVKSYQAIEPLTAVSGYFVNHAHNDYLEIALELGLIGVVMIALFLILYAIRAWRILFLHPAGAENTIARGALIAILCLLLHSMVDYPVRTFGHLALFGMLCALLYPFENSRLTRRSVRVTGGVRESR